MANGTVREIDDDHGSGFIAPDNGVPLVYCHMRRADEGAFALLRLGQRARFQFGRDSRDRMRVRAERVRPLDR